MAIAEVNAVGVIAHRIHGHHAGRFELLELHDRQQRRFLLNPLHPPLAARRDHLAQELETRIAAERRLSKELEARWRELDRIVRNEEQQVAALEQRLVSIETALAETDARLRYRRLELDAEQQWYVAKVGEWQTPQAELDEQIQRWRDVQSELAQRESTVRARLATFHRQTAPVIDYYRLINLLVTVPGQGAVDEVQRAMLQAITTLARDD